MRVVPSTMIQLGPTVNVWPPMVIMLDDVWSVVVGRT